MTINFTLISVLEVFILNLSILLSVAYVTIVERKTMASMQRRLGPNIVGFYGSFQAFADALKLILKEYVSPAQANIVLFFLGPIITLIFALFGYLVIPFGPGLVLGDLKLGILYLLAVSSLSTYGILLAGWSANSKYAFLGSLRSTAQLISYELVLSSGILVVIMLTGSLNITVIIEAQKLIWFIIPLLPLFLVLFIGSVAETNRAPFDLAEAESELVSGFMTEHSAVIFVFFFLAEYASIVLICMLNTILFLGGYLYNIDLSPLFNWIQDINNSLLYGHYYDPKFLDPNLDRLIATSLGVDILSENFDPSIRRFQISILNKKIVLIPIKFVWDYYLPKWLIYAFTFALKTCILIFVFILVRASYPRVRYDQLMSFCWTILLPVIIALIILVPCTLYNFEFTPLNLSFCLFFYKKRGVRLIHSKSDSSPQAQDRREEGLADINMNSLEEEGLADINMNSPEEEGLADINMNNPEEDGLADINMNNPEEDGLADINQNSPEEDGLADINMNSPEEENTDYGNVSEEYDSENDILFSESVSLTQSFLENENRDSDDLFMPNYDPDDDPENLPESEASDSGIEEEDPLADTLSTIDGIPRNEFRWSKSADQYVSKHPYQPEDSDENLEEDPDEEFSSNKRKLEEGAEESSPKRRKLSDDNDDDKGSGSSFGSGGISGDNGSGSGDNGSGSGDNGSGSGDSSVGKGENQRITNIDELYVILMQLGGMLGDILEVIVNLFL